MKRALNVSGNSKEIELPSAYDGFAHLLLDINPKGNPDIVCNARQLATLDPDQFDAVYCSHNLEHYYLHDVPKVLRGILHVLRTGCCALIRVPDVHEVMRIAVGNLEVVAYAFKGRPDPDMCARFGLPAK
jgi:SAM-dependent methyltransferase